MSLEKDDFENIAATLASAPALFALFFLFHLRS